MSIQQQVSRAIRILQGNRDVSARASHLAESNFGFQAEMEKFSKSTFSERKIMSTKTSIKRIAAVAAVALTLGGFSAVSAHAAATATIAVSGATGTGTATVTATAATSTYVSATVTFTGDLNNATQITSTGVGSINVPSIAAGTNNVATTGVTATSAVAYAAAVSTDVPGTSTRVLSSINGSGTVGTLAISAYSATAGTQTISVASSTGTSTLTITWGAASGTVYNHSSVYISTTTTADATADSTTLSGVSTASDTPVAIITVRQYSSVDTATAMLDASATAVSVSVTGAGSVGLTAATRGPSATAAAGAASSHGGGETTTGTQKFLLFANGVAGTATVAVTVNGVAVSSKTYTFLGTPAAIKAVANLKVLKANGTAGVASGNVYNGTTSATDATTISGTTGRAPLSVFLSDANGNAADLNTYVVKAVSADTTIVASATCVAASSTNSVVGEYNCANVGVLGAASGKSTTVTATLYKADGTTVIASATPVTFTIGGAIAKTVLSTDATSYQALAPITVVVTSTDSAGNAAYDQDVTAVGTITSSVLLGGTLASPTKIIGGTGSKTGAYAPGAKYTGVKISGTDSTAAATAISTTFDVTVDTTAADAAQAAVDAANEATDAANAATDAANNAMDSADAAQQAALDAGDKADAALAAVTDLASKVADIATQISALSSLVSKIAASVAKISAKVKA